MEEKMKEPRLMVKYNGIITRGMMENIRDDWDRVTQLWKLKYPMVIADDTFDIINVNNNQKVGIFTRILMFLFILWAMVKSGKE